MKKKVIIYSSIAAFIFAYVIVGSNINEASKKILVAGMKSNTDYRAFMTDEVYDKLHPADRVSRYEIEYMPDNHSYKASLVPLHFFFIAHVTVKNHYDNGFSGFNEDVILTMKWKKGKWIATCVGIPA
ncbi:hypothetical protein [Paenibacillus sp. L3-i20]|uniref:hypothetical protein n=1 Tax=Paenibacillus sp. L3-i20 TaxID=2905833 RepID=UPI001EE0DC4F|nr:hypothetical protein [Paenibacillus sp. L3-i20]GKU78724.1 hypothetical protein L3i20_v231210 [Paenibacillus sp. L3-i20]